ncbi:hypothetical protein TWF694_004780 [Orbilia ellipsospora]|uniref:Uncharacterized protein n=1 Tax=Orbilia ellipsospora TaxID=2528407 RepID=A0AAV9WYD3_9PEZI
MLDTKRRKPKIMPPTDTPPELWVEDIQAESTTSSIPRSSLQSYDSLLSSTLSRSHLYQPHTLSLPFLLHTLHSLEPHPTSFSSRAKNVNPSDMSHSVETDVKLASSLAHIMVTAEGKDASAAVTMRVLSDRVQVFVATDGETDRGKFEDYLYNLVAVVSKIAHGVYNEKRWKGEKRLLKVILKGCMERIKERLKKLGDAAWAKGLAPLTEGEIVDWDQMLEFSDGHEDEESESEDDDTDRSDEEFQGVELNWESEPTNGVNGDTFSIEHYQQAIDQTKKGMLLFLTAIRKLPKRPSWMRIARFMMLARIMVRDRELLRPHIEFTDKQIKIAGQVGRYLDVVDMIIRKAHSPTTRRLMRKINVTEVPYPSNQLPPTLSPTPTTTLQVLNTVELEHFNSVSITPEALSLAYPNFRDTPWTYDPNEPKIHPELILATFISSKIKSLNLPYLAMGISKPSCWACDVYLDFVHQAMVDSHENSFFADQVYKNGCSGYIVGGEKWCFPPRTTNNKRKEGESDDEEDEELNGVEERVCAVMEEAVVRVVRKVRQFVWRDVGLEHQGLTGIAIGIEFGR